MMMTQQEQIDALQQRVKMLEERLSPTIGKVECGDSVILITEDGVKCYDGERVLYGLRITNWNTATKEVKYINQAVKYDKWFSTPEARTEYIRHNKPCLSRADVRNILNISVRQVGVPYRDVVWEELNKIVEQKLTNK